VKVIETSPKYLICISLLCNFFDFIFSKWSNFRYTIVSIIEEEFWNMKIELLIISGIKE